MAYAYFTDQENRNDINSQLASVAYVNETVKRLKDAISKFINNSIQFELYNAELKQLPEKEIDLSNIPAENIEEDSKHKFLTNDEIETLNNKPSMYDVNNMIDNLKKELLDNISKKFDIIFSNINSLDNIKYLIDILNDDDKSKKIIELINSKASNEELENHIKSISHINSNDREALDKIIRFIKIGCADWNAEKTEPNYIKNKPKSLPANGGNADTVSGYNIESLLNHQFENFIIGSSNNNEYIEDEVDIMLIGEKDTQHFFNKIKDGGIYSFRKGKYKCESIKLNNNEHNIIINGAGNLNTIFFIDTIKANNNITFNNICFDNCNIIVGNGCEFKNCNFFNCDITLYQSINCRFNSCDFYESIFIFDGACFNNMVINNRFLKSQIPFYSGGNNLIVNNIS